MKPFSEWPLDGLIGFILIFVFIGMIVISPMLRVDKKAIFKNGRYYLLPTIQDKVVGAGIFLGVAVISYGVSQAGHCSTMTPEENKNNLLIGILLAITFWGGLVTYIYKTFLIKWSFTFEDIIVETPFKKIKHSWNDFNAAGNSSWGKFLVFGNKADKLYTPSINRAGYEEFHRFIASRMMSISKPVGALFYDDATSILKNKRIYVSILSLNNYMQDRVEEGFFGLVSEINSGEILITKDNGEIFRAPANLGSIFPYEDYEDNEYFTWDIEVPENKKVDFVAIYYMTEGQEKNDHQ